jgi:hypothetical protein
MVHFLREIGLHFGLSQKAAARKWRSALRSYRRPVRNA